MAPAFLDIIALPALPFSRRWPSLPPPPGALVLALSTPESNRGVRVMIFRLGCRGDAPMPPRDAHSKNLLIISALVSKIFSYLLSFFLSFFLSFSPSSIWFLWRAADRIDRNPRRENGRKGSVTIPETIPADHRLEIILQPAAAVQFVVAVVVAVVIVAAAASAAFVAPDRVISMRLLIYVPLSIARKEIVSFYESSAVFLFLPEGGVVPFLDVI